MLKVPLSGLGMSSVAYVERAAFLSRELTRMKTRGSGDIENAMRAIERDYAIDYGVIWRLRYRLAWLKDISACVYARIEAAYIHECERQERKLAHDRQIAEKIAGSLMATHAAEMGNAPAEEGVPQNVDKAD